MNTQNLNSFLRFGYFLDYQNPKISLDLTGIDRQKYQGADESELVEIACRLWKNSINGKFEANQKHLVPISGGLDSRAILANLLEYTEAKNIYTYTFGTPKTLDYEIGNFIAKKFGTKHTAFSLSDHRYTLEEEIEVSKQIDHQTFLFHHPPLFELEKKFSDCVIWSGYILDWIAGSHLPKNKANDVELAKLNAYQEGRFVTSKELINLDDSKLLNLLDCDFLNSNILSYEEQIEANHHLVKYTAPHILYKKFNYVLPVMDTELFNFFMSVEDHHRVDQRLYKQMLLNSFPKEFGYKTKTNFGLPLNASKTAVSLKEIQNKVLRKLKLAPCQGINYLDFNEKIRTKADLRELIISNLNDLKNRDVVNWIDIDEILSSHLSSQGNHADALIVLASLEIHFKAGLIL